VGTRSGVMINSTRDGKKLALVKIQIFINFQHVDAGVWLGRGFHSDHPLVWESPMHDAVCHGKPDSHMHLRVLGRGKNSAAPAQKTPPEHPTRRRCTP
jgi:hypothetical protein